MITLKRHHLIFFACRIIGISTLMVCLFTQDSACDLVILKSEGETKTIYGHVVSVSDQEIEFKGIPGGAVARKIPREKIERIVITVSPKRMEQLNRRDLKGYRDLAEELAIYPMDGYARLTAIRLFLITAYWSKEDQQGLRKSAIRNLIKIGRTMDERNRFRTLGFLYGISQRNIELERPAVEEEIATDSMGRVLTLVQAIRQGRSEKANQLLNDPLCKSAFRPWQTICQWDEIALIASINRPSAIQLEKLLAIEIDIRVRMTKGGDPVVSPTKNYDWAAQAEQVSPETERLPSFLNVTEIDPRDWKFENGEWIKPTPDRN